MKQLTPFVRPSSTSLVAFDVDQRLDGRLSCSTTLLRSFMAELLFFEVRGGFNFEQSKLMATHNLLPSPLRRTKLPLVLRVLVKRSKVHRRVLGTEARLTMSRQRRSSMLQWTGQLHCGRTSHACLFVNLPMRPHSGLDVAFLVDSAQDRKDLKQSIWQRSTYYTSEGKPVTEKSCANFSVHCFDKRPDGEVAETVIYVTTSKSPRGHHSGECFAVRAHF